MDSAPRDGSRVLVCDEYGVPQFAVWAEGASPYGPQVGWRCQRYLPIWQPSFWLPLPLAPNYPRGG